jgi:hypothetical protein
MSDLTDGIANVTALTGQINTLKAQADSVTGQTNAQGTKVDPKQILVDIQKNFNDMLNSLVTSSDDENKTKDDPFAFYEESINAANNLKNQINGTSNNTATPVVGTTNNPLGSIDTTQINPLTNLDNLNLDKIF